MHQAMQKRNIEIIGNERFAINVDLIRMKERKQE